MRESRPLRTSVVAPHMSAFTAAIGGKAENQDFLKDKSRAAQSLLAAWRAFISATITLMVENEVEVDERCTTMKCSLIECDVPGVLHFAGMSGGSYNNSEALLLCPITGYPCEGDLSHLCEDYGCSRKGGLSPRSEENL